MPAKLQTGSTADFSYARKTLNWVYYKLQLEFVFLQKHRCLPPFCCHIVLYIQRPFILTNEIPREISQKSIKARVMVLALALCLMLIDIHIKFREGILNGFQVIEWKRLL